MYLPKRKQRNVDAEVQHRRRRWIETHPMSDICRPTASRPLLNLSSDHDQLKQSRHKRESKVNKLIVYNWLDHSFICQSILKTLWLDVICAKYLMVIYLFFCAFLFIIITRGQSQKPNTHIPPPFRNSKINKHYKIYPWKKNKPKPKSTGKCTRHTGQIIPFP